MSRMKVVILSSLYPPYNVGGAEKAVVKLAETLVNQGIEVAVISLTDGNQEIVEDWNGIRVYRLSIGNFYYPWLGVKKDGPARRILFHLRELFNKKVAKRVKEILREERPDIAHTVNLVGLSISVWSVARDLKIPIVHTLEDYYALCSRSTLYRNKKICEARCLDCRAFTYNRRPASAMVQVVTGCSHNTLKRHLDEGYFANAKSLAVYNCQPGMEEASSPEESELIFGFIGRLTEDKGVEVMLEAFCGLPNVACRLRIAGRGAPGYTEDLQARFHDPRIEWLGFVSTENFYRLVDVVIVPSVWAEPMGYVCVEALYTGNNVIASDTGGLREVAVLAPLHRLVVPGSSESLRDAMKKALDDTALWKTRNVPLPKTLEVFSEEMIGRQFRELYRGVLPAGPPG